MQSLGSLSPLIWGVMTVSLLAVISLVVGISLLLGTISHRRIALPVVWISASALGSSCTALILILMNS
jgi:hypothetical protein